MSVCWCVCRLCVAAAAALQAHQCQAPLHLVGCPHLSVRCWQHQPLSWMLCWTALHRFVTYSVVVALLWTPLCIISWTEQPLILSNRTCHRRLTRNFQLLVRNTSHLGYRSPVLGFPSHHSLILSNRRCRRHLARNFQSLVRNTIRLVMPSPVLGFPNHHCHLHVQVLSVLWEKPRASCQIPLQLLQACLKVTMLQLVSRPRSLLHHQ